MHVMNDDRRETRRFPSDVAGTEHAHRNEQAHEANEKTGKQIDDGVV